jgi:SAM-dependent methyltransferase
MTDQSAYFAYLKTRSRRAALYRRFILYPLLNRHISGAALDIGCGLGDMLAFRQNTVGADVNPHAVAYCRSRGLDARLIEDGCLPFADASFDTVILDNVLEHVPNPRALLREIHRVLKQAGGVLVGVPGERGYASDSDHKVFYDEPLLTATLAAAGFEVNRVLHVPFRSRVLARRLRQYCVYGVFRRQ